MAISQLETSLNFIENRVGKNLAEISDVSNPITSVRLSGCEKNLVSCLNALTENHSVINFHLICAYSIFSTPGCGITSLAELLRVNHTMTFMELPSNGIDDGPIQLLIEALKQNKKNKINLLNLGGNNIGYRGIEHIAKFLVRDDCKLNHLNLAGNKMSREGMECLSSALKNNNTLTMLNLNNCTIDNEGAEHLSIAIKNNHTITSVSLNTNLIDTLGARFLVVALLINDSITSFSITCNPIEAVYNLFSHVIRQNNVMKCLQLKSSIAKHIIQHREYFEALAQNNRMDHVELFGFIYDDYEPYSLYLLRTIHTILMKPSVTSINLRGSDNLPLNIISDVLRNNSSLAFIDLQNCRINDGGVRILAPAISRSKLVTLALNGNSFNKEGAECLLQHLALNQTITSLHESNREYIVLNNIDEATLNSMHAILNRNKIIQDRLSFNWGKISICIAFIRANRYSFFSESFHRFLPEIVLKVAGLGVGQQSTIKLNREPQVSSPSLLPAYENRKKNKRKRVESPLKTGEILAEQIGNLLGLKERCEISSITSAWHGLRFSERTSWAQIQEYAKILNQNGINASLQNPLASGTILIPGSIDIRGSTLEDLAESLTREYSSVNHI